MKFISIDKAHFEIISLNFKKSNSPDLLTYLRIFSKV